MKLRVKEEFLHYSIGGGRMKKIRLDNLPPELYEKYYNLGYKDFFEVVDGNTSKDKKDVLKTKKNDDKNNTGNKSIGLSDTDGESDIN